MLTPSLDDPYFESLVLHLHAAVDVSGFWTAVQLVFDQVMPNDACVLYLNYLDFAKTWSAAEILATPKANKPRYWMQRRRQVDTMPAFILSHPYLKLYQLSKVIPDSKLHGSEFFRRYMAAEGWHYTASLLFWRDQKLESEIAILRAAERGDFTEQEMSLLNRLHPHIETILQRLSAPEFSGRTHHRPPAERSAASRLHDLYERLTRAEHELVSLVREGCSNKEIAIRLDKSVRTVKTQLTSVYRKFDVRSRSRLLAMLP